MMRPYDVVVELVYHVKFVVEGNSQEEADAAADRRAGYVNVIVGSNDMAFHDGGVKSVTPRDPLTIDAEFPDDPR